jgi:uncharacterized protein YqhQ
MSDSSDKNNSVEDQSDENSDENDEKDVFRQRVVSVASILCGITSAYLSGITFGYMSTITLLNPLALAGLLSSLYFFTFNRSSSKGVLYIIGITLTIWYISSTFMLYYL